MKSLTITLNENKTVSMTVSNLTDIEIFGLLEFAKLKTNLDVAYIISMPLPNNNAGQKTDSKETQNKDK